MNSIVELNKKEIAAIAGGKSDNDNSNAGTAISTAIGIVATIGCVLLTYLTLAHQKKSKNYTYEIDQIVTLN